jgi:hypothetical protein
MSRVVTWGFGGLDAGWEFFLEVDPSNMSIGGNFRKDYKVATMANYYEQVCGKANR